LESRTRGNVTVKNGENEREAATEGCGKVDPNVTNKNKKKKGTPTVRVSTKNYSQGLRNQIGTEMSPS